MSWSWLTMPSAAVGSWPGPKISPRTICTSADQGPEPARLLVLHAPAMDAYFEELHRLWSSGEPPSREAERELMSRYGMEPA